MKVIDNIKSLFQKDKPKLANEQREFPTGNYRLVNSIPLEYDGVKNYGEAGPVKDYWMNYKALQLRSWAAFLDSDVAQTVVKRFLTWEIGSGLKLQSDPSKRALNSRGINIDFEDFNQQVESNWNVFSQQKKVSWNDEYNLHELAHEVKKNAIIGGDCVVVMRVTNGQMKIQIIDGYHIESPGYGTDELAQITNNGNLIRHGVEMSKSGKHLAYWVRETKDGNFGFKRIPCYSTVTGTRMAFMVYGLRARLDNTRGIPLLSVAIQTLSKLDRYKEATVKNAEEAAKIVYQVVHDQYSTGENPMQQAMLKAAGDDTAIPKDTNGEAIANSLKATHNGEAYNLGPGQEIKRLASNADQLYFKSFFSVNFEFACAAFEIPPDIASQNYDSNYSSSRAAIKDWENTLKVKRKDFATNFYDRIYKYWFEIELLSNRISAPGFLAAKRSGDDFVQTAYLNSRWVGFNVPHIDPKKEVEAERAKLGELGKNIPLTTVEQATENINGGDSESNIDQFQREYERSKELLESDQPNKNE